MALLLVFDRTCLLGHLFLGGMFAPWVDTCEHPCEAVREGIWIQHKLISSSVCDETETRRFHPRHSRYHSQFDPVQQAWRFFTETHQGRFHPKYVVSITV